jgi:peptidoglycan/LPS O-acetylase OafA/YrhL
MDGGMEFTLIIIALCSYFAVRAWVRARQKEREAFYRAEAVKKIAEMQGNVPESVLSLLRAAIQPSQPLRLRFGSGVELLHPAYHRSYIVRTLAELPDGGAAAVTEFIRQEDAREARQRLEFSKFGGLVTVGGGIGLLIFLLFYNGAEPLYLVGLIPILVGAAFLIYAFWARTTPKAEGEVNSGQ